MKNIKSYLDELEKLNDKYGLYIEGCGCCGSPYLVDKTNNRIYFDNINFTKDGYEFNKCEILEGISVGIEDDLDNKRKEILEKQQQIEIENQKRKKEKNNEIARIIRHNLAINKNYLEK